jgi:hypothetical protein
MDIMAELNDKWVNEEVRRIAKRILVEMPGHYPAIDHVALKQELLKFSEEVKKWPS